MSPQTQKEQDRLWECRFVKAIEKEKLYYFMLAASQTHRVLVVKTPENTKEDNQIEKRFLGYEWSNRKGSEGIKYLNIEVAAKSKKDDEDEDDTLTQLKGIDGICTPLFNPLDLDDTSRINVLIRQQFESGHADVPDDLTDTVKELGLDEMLSFSQVGFDKVINPNKAYKVEFSSQYKKYKLSDKVIVNPSKREIRGIDETAMVSFVEMASVSENGYIETKVDTPLVDLKKGSYTYFAEGDIIIAKITPCMENGKCAVAIGLTNGIGMGSSEFHVFRCQRDILNTYLFAILNTPYVRGIAQKNMTGSSGHRRVPDTFYKDMEIPLPPMNIQQKIAKECQKVDEELKDAIQIYVSQSETIKEIINTISAPRTKISRLCIVQGGKRVPKGLSFALSKTAHPYIRVTDFKNGTVDKSRMKYISDNVFEQIKRYTISSEDVYLSIAGTTGIVGIIPDSLEGANLTENAAKLVILDKEALSKKYLSLILQSRMAQTQIAESTTKVGVPKLALSRIQEIEIPVPSLSDQERIVSEIEVYEQRIAEARSIMNSCADRKQAILDRYLK